MSNWKASTMQCSILGSKVSNLWDSRYFMWNIMVQGAQFKGFKSTMSNLKVQGVQFKCFKSIMSNFKVYLFNLRVSSLPCLIFVILSMFVNFNCVNAILSL